MSAGNLSLERGLSILSLIEQAGEPLGVREIARRLDVSPAAAQRLIATLCERGHLEQVAETRRYGLGYGLIALARGVLRRDSIIGAAEAELVAIAGRSVLNAFLGVRMDGRGLYLMALQSRSPVVIRSSPGDPFHLHSTAMGKALLQDSTLDEIVKEIGGGPYLQLTRFTVTTAQLLHQQARAASARGYSQSIDEAFLGIHSIGAPVRGADGKIVAAISVAYPRGIGETTLEITDVGDIVASAASRISVAIGYRPPAAATRAERLPSPTM